jgi:nitrite reductase/ring-hydroxylating ferredoxin subunit
MPLVAIAKAQQLSQKRALQITACGIPITVTLGSDGKPRAFIRVCPHRWIVMKSVPRNHDCLLCVRDGVTFSIDTGTVRNTKGYRLRHGLHSLNAEMKGDDVVLHIDASAFSFFAYAMARRLGRKFKFKFR